MKMFKQYYDETNDNIFKKMYDEYNHFLIHPRDCEDCKNETHTTEQHARLKKRAYKRLYDRMRTIPQYTRKPYKDNFDIVGGNNAIKV